ncbi:neoverrucotoxin subunit beta-like [Tachysurus ichikawai]
MHSAGHKNSFAALTERVTGAETRLDEAERRISSAEDSTATAEGQLTRLKEAVYQLQAKNRGHCKNLKIVSLPEKSEGFTDKEEILKVAQKKTVTHNGSVLRFYSDLSAGLLQKRREFATVGKALAARGVYRGFAYPARLRCLHNGKITLFNDPKSAKAFLDSLDD